ncbi:MAG: hypothetical protein K0R03_1493 [Moraxellaceae bacterium]|jgi:uncharacterized protein YqcC (DUF446 family)|nr:hypothetical protein [Moraxellaceae bacterium]
MQLADRHQFMLELLRSVETELRSTGLWSAAPPSPAALASTAPFMYDTLRLHEWLQWVFLPRTRAVIDASSPLPGNCHIHALAEHEFARLQDVDTARLLNLIRQVDDLMNLP